MGRRPLAIAIVLLLGIGGSTALPAPAAHAAPPTGDYDVEACTPAVGYLNNSWLSSVNNTTYLEVHTTCGEGAAPYNAGQLANLEVGDVTELSESAPIGVAGEWRFAAPAGTTIAVVNGDSSLYRSGGRSWQVYRESENTSGEVDVEQSCDQVSSFSCSLGGIFQATALHARSISFGVLCTAEEYEPGEFFTTCPSGALEHFARAGIDYATVTLADPHPPSEVKAEDVPTGPQRGIVTIGGSASDSIAGLLSLSVVNDSGETVVGPVSVPGGCNYSELTPCPTSAIDLPLSIATEKLPEGEDQLRVLAINAAHDEALSEPFTITVANQAPPPKEEAPGGESKAPTSQEGSGSTGGETSSGGDIGGESGDGGSSGGDGGGGGTTSTEQPPKEAGREKPRLRLREARMSGSKLTITGSIAAKATGRVDLVLLVERAGKRRWQRRLTATVEDGRIRAAAQLLRGMHPRSLTVTLTYPGNKSFLAATLRRRLAIHDRSAKRSRAR